MTNAKTELSGRRERLPERRRTAEGKYAARLAELESMRAAAASRAAAEQPGTEEKDIADIRAATAALQVDIFLEEHDSTGAWKGERFGRDAARDLRDVLFERDSEGRMAITTEDERHHLLIVNMGELDRLNTSEAHALGDEGLRLTMQRIESAVRDILKQETSRMEERALAASYDVYRISGNDFGIILRNVDVDDAEVLRQTLSRERVSIEALREGEDPVPLTASRVSRADGIRLLNDAGRPGEEGADDFTPKMLIRAMEEKAQTLNDVEKVRVRSERAIEKIIAVERGDLALESARDFFNLYLKKSLGSAFREDPAQDILGFEQFQRLAEARGGISGDVRSVDWIHFVTERSMADALEQLKARRAVGREIENRIAQKVASDVLKKEASFGFAVDAEVGPVSTPEFEPVGSISGKERLRTLLETAMDLARKKGEGEKVSAEADLAQAAFELERAKRDAGRTGLYTRGQYFRTMESAFEGSSSITTIVIDMAFLKYFDKEGGPATGNIAIEKTAEILDRVARSYDGSGIAVEAYRTGGDEFALTIVGGNERVVQDVIGKIREHQNAAGRVPPQPGAKPSYFSEGLQFNLGARTATSMETFRSELVSAGIQLTRQETPGGPNELAEYLSVLADKEIELNKATDRILFLALRTAGVATSGNPRNLEVLKAYSEKGIFGTAGLEMVEKMAEELAAAGSTIEIRRVALGRVRMKILQFVIGEIDAKMRKKQGVESVMGRRIEDAVRERYLEQRVAELEEEIRTLKHQLAAEKGASQYLSGMVAAAEQERNAVVHFRSKMGIKTASTTRRAA